MPHLRRFESLTHEALGSLSHVSNVKFGPSLDERLDLFSAHETTERPPIVVFVHGGYWRLSDGNDYGFVARGLHRFAAVNVVNYTLVPKAPLGEIVRQVRAAITWTWHNAHRTGGDRDRIYVVGHSAGAHLTVMAALTDWSGEYGLPANLIEGAFAISGLYDLRPLPYSFVGPALQLTGRDILELSPMLRDLPARAPRLKIAYGEDETPEFIRQSDDFLMRWRAADLQGDSSIRSDRNHFSIMLDLAEPDSDLVREIAAFMR